MRPLRPATDLRLGEPLPHQLANQPRPPPKADCSFDLAMLCGISPGFPELFPTQGQVVTCYSPGRHCTQGLLPFLVRLACVRHAASVDSEPGSNSRLKPENLFGTNKFAVSRSGRQLSCEYVQTLSPNISISQLARSTFCQRPIRFPPERCAFSPYRFPSGNPYVLETFQTYSLRAAAVNPLKSQDFHLISTAGEFTSRKLT